MGNQIVSTSSMLRFICFIFVCVVESLMIFSFGNFAKDFTGVVPLSAPSEDQGKSAQHCQSFSALHQHFSFSANIYCRRM